MFNIKKGLVALAVGVATFSGVLFASGVSTTQAAGYTGWRVENGKYFWYENDVKQGVKLLADGTPDPTYRGKEIYDPGTDAWYWLDNVQYGAKAVSKDVYQESKADDNGNIGKWVRYDANGHMIKGFDRREDGTWYFDPVYGTMAKGEKIIDNKLYYFNTDSGVGVNGWANTKDGNSIWYENGERQGCLLYFDSANGYYDVDLSYRGKEIYDPGTDAWYWLDNVNYGSVALDKDVYQESKADDVGNIGKWVRYDKNGHMIKGWNKNDNGTYYFDLVYGTMYKGSHVIDGVSYFFDEATGVLVQNNTPEETPIEEINYDPAVIYNKLIAMKDVYPEGMHFTNESNSYVWYNSGDGYNGKLKAIGGYSTYTGKGCVAFAFELSDVAFGEGAPVYKSTDLSSVRVGDIIRINNNSHSVIVLEVKEKSVIVAEANLNSKVHWGRELFFDTMRFDYIFTRYPQ